MLFGPGHLLALLLICSLGLGLSRMQRQPGVGPLAQAMAWALLGMALCKPVLFVLLDDQPWRRSLPFDLCRINEFFCVILLLRRSYRMFEIAYFLAMAGSTSALLMPDLLHGFPDPRFLSFFAGHGLGVLAVLYAVFAYGFRPTLRSLRRALLFLVAYAVLMVGVNRLLDANYLFLRWKPEGASLLDLLGPWPVYLVWLSGIAVVACGLCYLPFAFGDDRRRRSAPPATRTGNGSSDG